MADTILAAPAARDRTEETLRLYLERARLAEVHLGQARKALNEADFLIEAIRELVNAFPPGNRYGGTLGDLARKLDWLEVERSRVAGRAQRRAHITVRDLGAELGWTRSKVYRRLEQGYFPGATQPGGHGAEWLIPADTVDRMNGNGKGE